ncbi:MAG: carboxymuconolactone decarboxylase family protein [Gammaproteobacteria bacterium]
MSLDAIKDRLPEYAKDVKLNLSSLLSGSDASGLSPAQVAGIALASALTTREGELITLVKAYASEHLDEKYFEAVKAAATIMAMNNVYYRFTHMVSDKEYSTLPARLRMNAIANHGIEKIDFELYSLAVSAINACGMCIDAHVNALQQHAVSKEAIQACIRIAAVINSAAQSFAIERVF